MYVKLIAGVVAAVGIAGWGFAAGHYVAGEQEEKRIETCAAGIRNQDVSKCPQRIIDAFSTLSNTSAQETIQGQTVVIREAGRSYAAELQALEDLKADLRDLATQPQTNQCASAPAMVTLREQICQEVGGCE